jgi:hypothetical protein
LNDFVIAFVQPITKQVSLQLSGSKITNAYGAFQDIYGLVTDSARQWKIRLHRRHVIEPSNLSLMLQVACSRSRRRQGRLVGRRVFLGA